jgi:hypothetical protein
MSSRCERQKGVSGVRKISPKELRKIISEITANCVTLRIIWPNFSYTVLHSTQSGLRRSVTPLMTAYDGTSSQLLEQHGLLEFRDQVELAPLAHSRAHLLTTAALALD